MSVALLAFKETMKELKAFKDGDTLHVVQMRPKIYTAPLLMTRIWAIVKNVLSCSCLRKNNPPAEEISVKESIIRLIHAHHDEAEAEDLDGIAVCETYLKTQTGNDVANVLQRIAKIRERLHPPTDLSASLTSMRMSGHINGIQVTADLIDNLLKEGKYQHAATELNRTKRDHEIRDLGKLLGAFFIKAKQDKQAISRLDKLMQIAGADLHSISIQSSHFEEDDVSNEILEAGFRLILSRCKNLERMSVDDKLICQAKPDFSSCLKLESFTIHLTGGSQAIIALGDLDFNKLKTLKIIIARGAKVTNIPAFKVLEHLTTLGIYDMRAEKEFRLLHLYQIPTLQDVELQGFLLGEEDKAAFKNAPQITTLKLSTISDQSIIAEICKIKSLTSLSLSLAGITYKTFLDLAESSFVLTTLVIRAVAGESGPDLVSEYLTKFPKLESLSLPNFTIKSLDDVKTLVTALMPHKQLARISIGVASRAVDTELKNKFKEAYPNITIETGLKS